MNKQMTKMQLWLYSDKSATVAVITVNSTFIFCLTSIFPESLILSGFLQIRGNWKKSEFQWSRKGQGEFFFLKVTENEKLVPPDVRFSG